MNPRDPNVLFVETVAKQLGHLTDKVVFVGGSAAGLLITDDGTPPVRPTRDVDVVAEITTVRGYYELHEDLRRCGFREDEMVNCRWRLGQLKIDVMPVDGSILGSTNKWYPQVVQQSSNYALPSGRSIRLVAAPVFLATKLEAFYGRGNGDYGGSHDIEDIVVVVDGRPELLEEVRASDQTLRSYLREEFEDLLADPPFVDSLSWHFPGDEQSQARVPEVVRRLRVIAGL